MLSSDEKMKDSIDHGKWKKVVSLYNMHVANDTERKALYDEAILNKERDIINDWISGEKEYDETEDALIRISKIKNEEKEGKTNAGTKNNAVVHAHSNA